MSIKISQCKSLYNAEEAKLQRKLNNLAPQSLKDSSAAEHRIIKNNDIKPVLHDVKTKNISSEDIVEDAMTIGGYGSIDILA